MLSYLITWMRANLRSEKGQDLAEYALLIALIALVAFAAVELLGGQINTIFTNIQTQLGAHLGG